MKKGYFGDYGGCFAAETLIQPLHELETAYRYYMSDATFQSELKIYMQQYVGRPTPLTFAQRLTTHCAGAQIYLKREDLTHTGAHKINNALGQGLLAKKMGKKRVIAETGAGQHGVATASVCAQLGLECTVYMGAKDMQRQALNVKRMRLLGATVVPVNTGACTLKDAVNEAMRDWVTHIDSYYILGSALGPHPYPSMVRDFQTVIGREVHTQILAQAGQLPTEMVACVGGGSNAIGLFYPFLEEPHIQLVGVEAGGTSIADGQHAARFAGGSVGVFQGTKTFLLQNEHGQVQETHSISAGLDYPGVGPEHAHLHSIGRVHYTHASDDEALEAAIVLARLEGILPALESAHALAYVLKRAPKMSSNDVLVVNISGRGDKDVESYGTP